MLILGSAIFFFLNTRVALALKDCDNVYSDNTNTFTGLCNNKWSNLKPLVRPTQSQVGYAWIKYKLEKSFTSSSSAQDEMSDSVPAVLGPDGYFYIVDDHHTLSALDYSGYSDVSVTLDVLCDKRSTASMDIFYKYLEGNNFIYLGYHPLDKPNVLPEAIAPQFLPTIFSFTSSSKSFTDDPWRSMAGYSRKVSDSEYRCMYRGCGDGSQSSGASVPYFEFKWSYFMLDATYYNSSYWPSPSSFKAFYTSYQGVSTTANIDKIDTSSWKAAAELIIPLCRAELTGSYALPSAIYGDELSLPGYVQGMVALADDPTCVLPECI